MTKPTSKSGSRNGSSSYSQPCSSVVMLLAPRALIHRHTSLWILFPTTCSSTVPEFVWTHSHISRTKVSDNDAEPTYTKRNFGRYLASRPNEALAWSIQFWRG